MGRRLLLNQYRNVDSDMANMTVPIDLGNNRELIVDDKFAENVNLYSVYLDEREVCTKVRLTAQINLIASNIIFNSVTEIVKYEGSNSCECLNFTPKAIPQTLGKNVSYLWGSSIKEAVMDTQITSRNSPTKNYTYLCGIDIFNNHVIRSKTKFPISFLYNSDSDDIVYNTIEDYYRDRWGRVNGYTESAGSKVSIGPQFLHRYTKSNIMTFSESVEKNLENRNGWIGFINKGQMLSTGFGYGREDKVVGIENVINNESKNKFIHLFPGKDRYEFKPHYNSARNRYEKNWEYVITYPSSHTTDGIPFINPYLDTLKIAQIDENQHDDDGIYRCVVYSVSKHGLVPGDKINMYRSRIDDDSVSDIVELNMNVDNVIDDYVFSVYTSDSICKKWISAFDKNAQDEYGIQHVAGTIFALKSVGQIISVSDYLNVDFDTEGGHIGSNNLSFAKVVDGVQCKYYVRIMSRLPNFDFYEKELTEENIYKPEISGHTAVEEYSKEEYERQSSVSKLGFSKNIYGDDMYQIVFNDDIDISLIKDNLGRPLTSLYLTFFKTNYGRTEWYVDKNVNSKDVEWSRCFGKLNCGFEYSPYIDDGKWSEGNIHVMNNIGMVKGLVTKAVTSPSGGEDDDEIRYKVDSVYYGDLCMYSPSECIETVIQDLQHRFNTMQREYFKYGDERFSGFSKVYYDDINSDDYMDDSTDIEQNKFNITESTYDETADSKPEGCFYKANYEIPIRTFSQTLRRFTPDMISVSSFEPDYAKSSCTVHTSSEHGFFSGGSVCVYDSVNGIIYNAEKLDITATNGLLITWDYDEPDSPASSEGLMIYEVSEKIPSYAEPVPDSPGSYIWRNIVPNGFEETEGIIEDYPFVNGCLYVNKEINLFLRRQDPFGQFGLANQAIYYGLPQVTGKINPYEEGTAMNYDDTINEGYVTC